MAVPECIVKEQWLGNNALSQYTFDFTIQDLQHLLVLVQDMTGAEVYRIRGDDISFLAGVTFDSKAGGGTISLQNVLPNGWILTALQANDAPTQPSEFKDKFSFTLERFELALDYLITSIQRLAYLAQRSMKLHDLDDSYAFNPMLPMGIASQPRATIIVNAAGNGFDYGPTADTILEAADFAEQAANSAAQAAADVVQTDADVVAAAASALASANSAIAAAAAASASLLKHTGPFASIAPNANANLLSETTASAANKMVEYTARIIRGTGIFAAQKFTIFFRNGAWEIAVGQDLYADAASDHGVTFTVDPVTAQINAAVANDGGSNAVIDLVKTLWPL